MACMASSTCTDQLLVQPGRTSALSCRACSGAQDKQQRAFGRPSCRSSSVQGLLHAARLAAKRSKTSSAQLTSAHTAAVCRPVKGELHLPLHMAEFQASCTRGQALWALLWPTGLKSPATRHSAKGSEPNSRHLTHMRAAAACGFVRRPLPLPLPLAKSPAANAPTSCQQRHRL